MNSFFEWLAMGGYSIYVWPAYGVFFGVLLINLVGIKIQKIRTRQKLQHWFKR